MFAAILSFVTGVLGGAIPEIIKYFKDKRDQKHEIAILTIQREMAKEGHLMKMEEVNALADIKEQEILYQTAEIRPMGWKWLDALLNAYNGSVRPTLAYAMTAFYGIFKYAQYDAVKRMGVNTLDSVRAIYTETDEALFCMVLGFYFGQRSMKYALGRVDKSAQPK